MKKDIRWFKGKDKKRSICGLIEYRVKWFRRGNRKRRSKKYILLGKLFEYIEIRDKIIFEILFNIFKWIRFLEWIKIGLFGS